MINQIKRWFFYKELTAGDHRKKYTVKESFNNQQNIGILFDGTNEDDRKTVHKFKKNLNPSGLKNIKSLTFLDNSLPLDNVDYAAYNHKTIKWNGIPYGEKVDEFIAVKFDLLIVLCQKMLPHYEFIIANSQSQFTIGPLIDLSEKYFDLTVDTQNSYDLQKVIQKIISAVQLVSIK